MLLGFCGKNLEAAQFLLREAELDSGPRGQRLRRLAETIIASFLRLKVAPPEAEGFRLDSDEPVYYLGRPEVFLRSFGDDLKSLLKAYRREKQLGREHPEWLAWCRSFGDWLLTQQQPRGGFPRSVEARRREVISASPNSSYNAVPLLLLLTETTGERRYLEAAIRAADFCWSNGQSDGRFVGGTIDNPDVLDKEAATLSLEAYLHLHQATGDRKWLQRAVAAADFAETWIYIWNVPMPADGDDAERGWKRGVSTVGLQLISTGHSLADAYMAFDADEFAQLAKLTGDCASPRGGAIAPAQHQEHARPAGPDIRPRPARLAAGTLDSGALPRPRLAPPLAALGRHQSTQWHLRPDGRGQGVARGTASPSRRQFRALKEERDEPSEKTLAGRLSSGDCDGNARSRRGSATESRR